MCVNERHHFRSRNHFGRIAAMKTANNPYVNGIVIDSMCWRTHTNRFDLLAKFFDCEMHSSIKKKTKNNHGEYDFKPRSNTWMIDPSTANIFYMNAISNNNKKHVSNAAIAKSILIFEWRIYVQQSANNMDWRRHCPPIDKVRLSTAAVSGKWRVFCAEIVSDACTPRKIFHLNF